MPDSLGLSAGLRSLLKEKLHGPAAPLDDAADTLRNLCADKLEARSFDQNYAPTPLESAWTA